mmetsp:Transcript_124854/g.266421  ORF Transcript_124854/g.266421 Transcript_124854/m.266421 type:complete len:606 (-) Transcript_124854:58-1875(-)
MEAMGMSGMSEMDMQQLQLQQAAAVAQQQMNLQPQPQQQQMQQMQQMGTQQPQSQQPQQMMGGTPGAARASADNTTVLRMRGLPFRRTAADIKSFFEGFQMSRILPVTLMADGRPGGEAYVEFTTEDEALRAFAAKQNAYLQSRYVELFPSTLFEMNQKGLGQEIVYAVELAPESGGTPEFASASPNNSAISSGGMSKGGGKPTRGDALKVFAGGLPKDASEAAVRTFFSNYGTVTGVQLKYTDAGVFRGFGFISFSRQEEASAVVMASQGGSTLMQGKWIDCKEATTGAGKGEGKGKGGGMWKGGDTGMGGCMGMGGGMGMGMGAGGPQAEAQLICMELAKRMEEFYPVLQQAAGERVATGAAAQQGFVAYSYSFSQNIQQLQQMNAAQFNPAVHVDYAKWVQAMQNNPDPQSCYPEPLVGLKALEARVQAQQSAVEQCNAALEELKTGYGNLKDSLQVKSLQKLEECRQRHQKLSRQLLEVVTAVESYAVLNGAARRSPHVEAQLEDRFARLEEAVHAPASARARLEELWVVLRGLLQRGPPSGTADRLSDAEAEKTLRLTASQGELLELLQEELARRRRDVSQFESALARFTTAAPSASQTI